MNKLIQTKADKPRSAVTLRRSFFQTLIACTLLAGIFFNGLPAVSQAQTGGTTDDSLKMSGAPQTLRGKTNRTSSKMSAASYTEMRTAAEEQNSGTAKAKNAQGVESVYSVFNVEFTTAVARRAVFTDAKVSKLAGATPLTAFDRFADVFVSTDAAWRALANNPNVVRVEFDTEVTAPPPIPGEPSKLISQAIPEKIIRGGHLGLTGKNVIIAVLDTGIDFRHPDFISYDAKGVPTSRIAYLWDTATGFQPGRPGSAAPAKFPNGTSIGTLYTKEQLTSELRAATQTIPATDLDGHGTACASVAAGNGNADKLAGGLKRKEVEGVAPEAEIIGVRLGYEGLENSYLLNRIAEWLDTVAQTKPLVISGSFGGHYTGHDGQTVTERQLNARFPLNKAGRAIVFAAGNEGNDKIHAQATFGRDAKLVSWVVKEQTQVMIYFNSNDGNIRITGTRATPLGDNLRIQLNPITQQYSATITVSPGVGGVWFENPAGRMADAHLYFYNEAFAAFSPEYVSYSHLVGAPGSMENAITVGSYDWNDNFHKGGNIVSLQAVCHNREGNRMPFEIGFLSCYSSPGPNRNGLVKPDIVSPGEWYASANAKDKGVTVAWGQADTTGYYRQMNGTSAATPYTSGVIALMFQKKPALTLGEIKGHFKSKASKNGLNPFAQAVPNNNWGYGKLDLAAIERIFAAL